MSTRVYVCDDGPWWLGSVGDGRFRQRIPDAGFSRMISKQAVNASPLWLILNRVFSILRRVWLLQEADTDILSIPCPRLLPRGFDRQSATGCLGRREQCNLSLTLGELNESTRVRRGLTQRHARSYCDSVRRLPPLMARQT